MEKGLASTPILILGIIFFEYSVFLIYKIDKKALTNIFKKQENKFK
ncbi:hypothetical protein LEP1GSC082_0126 [Leptospira kirschneri str. H2]|uniref:Uncharacterized protein n=1 Tax=Leptospira kirschneri serovar Bulgarica str. Nikolaevo TaxID=1240687 RepID=M6EYW7_9LEPT|nr:hypothetical protein LEP1GSC082_0126 [Leptospira kirschneri str. H2]EMK20032.1 hypothetical protein LEP1GSC008_2974 [Leptospira kirschneri serovar Bulgarica str. Nikolaevo]